MSRNSKCKKGVSLEQGTITFTFTGMEPVVVSVDGLSADIRREAMFHGVSQKLGDSFAGAKTVAEAREAFDAVLESLQDGEWNRGREGSGTIFAEAISELTGRERAEVDALLKRLRDGSDEEKKVYRAAISEPNVQKRVAEIRLERAQKAADAAQDGGIDLAGLFGG